MGYSPNNDCVYLKALAGALIGLGASTKYLDGIAADAAVYARMADAYAQEFDAVWGLAAPTTFEEDAIISASERVWAARSPLENDHAYVPGAYFGIVSGVIALITEGNTQVVSEGVDPNSCGAGTSGNKPIALFVDPQNTSGRADDGNKGQTASTPIRTTAENNRRMAGATLTSSITITYLSDDNEGFVDFQTLNFAGFFPIFQGTPQVQATTTLTAVTAMSPATNTREKITTALADLRPFVRTTQGGTAVTPYYFVNQTAPRAGNQCWLGRIVPGGEGGAPNVVDCSNPVIQNTPISVIPAVMMPGDTVQIVRGSRLSLASMTGPLPNGLPDATSLGPVQFNDFEFRTDSTGNIAGSLNMFIVTLRCSHDLVQVPALLESPYIYTSGVSASAISLGYGGVTIDAGFYESQPADLSPQLILGTDCYVTGAGIQVGGLLFGFTSFVCTGAQFWNTTGEAAIQVFAPVVLGAAQPATVSALVWGNANVGFGVLLWPGAVATVPGLAAAFPTVSGTAGDFGFVLPGNGVSHTTAALARTFSEGSGALSNPAVASTWANLANAASLNFNAHNGLTGARVVAVGGT